MVQNILDYLEATAEDCPDKPAFEDLEHSYTFAQVLGNAKRIGSALIHVLPQNAPVPVLMEKEAWTLNVFMGAVCAGCFYTLVEPEQPDERIRTILEMCIRDRDMVFMTKEQRRRHKVTQGLTGLAQVSGRNNISWEEKLAYDQEYVKHITCLLYTSRCV